MAAWQEKMWTQSAAALTLLPAEHAAPSQAAVARYYKKVFGSKPELHGPMYDVKMGEGHAHYETIRSVLAASGVPKDKMDAVQRTVLAELEMTRGAAREEAVAAGAPPDL